MAQTDPQTIQFADRSDRKQLEEGLGFAPKFDADGLIPAIATDAQSGEVLMFAFMNEEALRQTILTAEAHFYSRSRGKQWKKGESSGHVLKVHELRTDCDQDVVWMRCTIQNGGGACHVGYKSCFYRAISLGEQAGSLLTAVGGEKLFDPEKVYGK